MALSCLNSFRGRSHLQLNAKYKVPCFSACDLLGEKQLNNKLSVCLQAFLLDGKDYVCTWKRAPWFLFDVYLSQWLGASGWGQMSVHFQDRPTCCNRRLTPVYCNFMCWGATVSLIRHSGLEIKALHFSKGPECSYTVTSWRICGVFGFLWGRKHPQETSKGQPSLLPGARVAKLGLTRSTQRFIWGLETWIASPVLLCNL